MIHADPRIRSKLISPGLVWPVGSDRFTTERLEKIKRGTLRRNINGRAKYMANGAGGRIYRLELSMADAMAPALDGVWEGLEFTLTPTEKLKAFIPAGTLSVTVDRTPIAAGLDPDGIHLEDQRTGQRILGGWGQSGFGLRTFTLAAPRATTAIVCYRFTSLWVTDGGITMDRDVQQDRTGSKLTFEEVEGSSF